MRSPVAWLFALVAALGIATGCSGSKAILYQNPPSATPPPLASVAVTVALPMGSKMMLGLRSGTRGRRSLSTSNVQSLTVQAASQGEQVPAALIATQPNSANCTASGNTLQCTGTVQAPVGNAVAFAIVLYAKPNAQGAPLAAGTIVQNVPSSGATLSIDGATLASFAVFIATLNVGLTNATFPAGTPATFTFSFNGYDVT